MGEKKVENAKKDEDMKKKEGKGAETEKNTSQVHYNQISELKPEIVIKSVPDNSAQA